MAIRISSLNAGHMVLGEPAVARMGVRHGDAIIMGWERSPVLPTVAGVSLSFQMDGCGLFEVFLAVRSPTGALMMYLLIVFAGRVRHSQMIFIERGLPPVMD